MPAICFRRVGNGQRRIELMLPGDVVERYTVKDHEPDLSELVESHMILWFRKRVLGL